MKENKQCIYPGCTELAVRNSYCRTHDNLLSAERHRRRYHLLNGKIFDCICEGCGAAFKGTSNHSKFCDRCKSNYRKSVSIGEYKGRNVNGSRIDEHRMIAKSKNLIKDRFDVVHHLDGDKSNNNPGNLVVLRLADHGRLHSYLLNELAKNQHKTIAQLSWEFIWQNEIPYCFCNAVPDDFELN